ncbi:MAG: mannosyltransferase [Bacteroidota bacterium]
MIQFLEKYWKAKPLILILIAGGVFRLLSVAFSKGYGMQDDHFLVIEVAQSWVDGHDTWLPENRSVSAPTGHSMFYTGLHYMLFLFLESINITGPQIKMYIVRFIHAVYSLSMIWLGYKITFQIAGKNAAKNVGLILALLWFFPILSVRNLVEFVCIPPLLYATWIILKNESRPDRRKVLPFISAGLIAGIAIAFRFHSILFVGGLGLVMLLRKRILGAFLFGLFCFISVFITQVTDFFTWGFPFAEMGEYIRYNFQNPNTYFTQKWYLYLLFIAGIMVPPVSIFLLFGFVFNWKKHLLLFLPALIFLLFHSYFPNKQERFILPVIPFIIILGYVGWNDFINRGWLKNHALLKYSWAFFWIINTILVCAVSPAYSKKSRIEAMEYLSKKDDFQNFILEYSHKDNFRLPPLFYLGKWVSYFHVTKKHKLEKYEKLLETMNDKKKPNYVIFVDQENLENRIKELKKVFPDCTFEAKTEPSYLDKVLHYLNPVNKNESCYIYKIGT